MNNAFEDALRVAVDHGSDTAVSESATPSMDMLSRAVYVQMLGEAAMPHHRGAFGMLLDGPPEFSGAPYPEPYPFDADEDLALFNGNEPSDVSEVERYLSLDQREDALASVLGTGANDPFLSGPEQGSVDPETERTTQDIVRDLLRNM